MITGVSTRETRRRDCGWKTTDSLLLRYHDEEWGIPVHDDRLLFEHLVLDGAQAGLSWSTILHRREAYREAFQGFDPALVALYTEQHMARLLADARIIRNRRKIEAAVGNARAVLEVQREFGSLDRYLWGFVGGGTVHNGWTTLVEVPTESPESLVLSQDLRRRGFRFVGPTICYAFMQAVGMVNDHLVSCWRHDELRGNGR